MAQALRHGQLPDPCLDDDGKLSILFSQQYRGYRNIKRNVKQQKALLLIVLHQLIKTRSSIKNIAIDQLCTGALFFAMRSCEYLCTNIAEEKHRTNTLRIRNLHFFKKGLRLVHSDRNLYLANTITRPSSSKSHTDATSLSPCTAPATIHYAPSEHGQLLST